MANEMSNKMYWEFVALTNKIHYHFQSQHPVVGEPVEIVDGTFAHGITASPIITRTMTKEQFDNESKWNKISTDALLFLKENQM
jgi:hypothetical protein